MTKIPDIVKQLREEEKVGLFNFNSNSELEQIMPGEANESMQEEIYSSMDESFDDKSNKDLSESFDLIEDDINLILNEISDMVMYIDNKGRIIKINNAGLGFSGFKKEEVIGKYFWTLPGVLSKKNIPKYMKVFKDTLKGKKSKDFIADLKDKSGNKHIMNWSAYPKIVYGKVDYIMIIARDITKKKELESRAYMDQELLLNLMHNTTDYIYFKDKDSKYIKLNKSTAKALCGSEDVSKVIGKSDFDFFPDIAKKILAQEKKIMKTDIPQVNEEMKATFADGNKHWVSVTKVPFKDRNGRVTGIIGISRDITEKKKKEKDIKESEKKYRNLVENLNEGIWQIDKDGYTVFVNNKLIKILGYSNKEIIGEHFFEFMDEQFVEIAKEKLNKKIGKKDSFELEFLKKNNKKIHCNVNISPIYEDEKYSGSLLSLEDITDKKKKEEKINNVQTSYETIFNSSTDSIFIHDFKTGKIIDVNQAALDRFGYTKEEIKNLNVGDLSINEPPYTQKEAFEWIKKAANEGTQQFEWCSKTKKGEIIWHENVLQKVKIGGEDRVLVTARDITEKVKTEEKLKESERRLKDAEKTAKIGYVEWDCEQQKAIWSDTVFELYKRDKELGTPPYDEIMALHSPEDAKRLEEAVTLAITKGISYQLDLKVNLSSGKTAYHHVIGNPVKNKEGKVTKILGTVQDVTKQKKAEEKLKETLDATTAGIWTWNFKKDKLFFSDKYYTMLGYKPQEFKANFDNWTKLIHPDDKEKALEVAKKYLKTKPDVYENEFRLKTKNGKYRWIRAKAKVVERDKNGEAIRMIGNHEDITQQKKAEERLKENQEKFKQYFDKSPYGIFVTDEKGNYIDVNKEACKTTGYTKEELLKMNLLDLFSEDDKKEAQDSFKNLQEKGEYSVRIPFIKKDGEKKFWIVSAVKISDGCFVGFTKDITEQERVKKQLKESEKKYRELFNNALVGIDIHNSDGSIYSVNKRSEDVFGLSEEELKKKDLSFWKGKLIKPDGKPIEPDEFPLSIVAETKKPSENKVIGLKMSSDDEIRWYLHSARPILNENGEIDKVVTSFIDITERKKTEDIKNRLLKESQFLSDSLTKISTSKNLDEACKNICQSLHEYIGKSIVAVNLYNKNDNLFVNRSIYGIEDHGKIEEILGKKLSKLKVEVPKEIHDEIKKGTILEPKEGLYELMLGSLPKSICSTLEKIMKIKDIFAVPLYHNKKLYGNMMIFIKKENKKFESKVLETFGYQCSVILQRLATEEELKESERKYRKMVEMSPDGIAISDLKGILKSCNKSFLDITGFSREEMIGKHISRLPTIDFKEFPNYLKIYKNILLGKQENPFVFRWRHKNGELKWGECIYTALHKNGKKTGVQVVLRDITQRKKHDEELRKFKTISDKAQYGVNLNTMDGTTVYVNYAFAKMHGYKKEELVGKPHDILHIEEEITTKIKDARQRLKKGEHIFVEETHKKKDGTLFPVQVNASVIPDKNGKPLFIAGIITDLTEYKKIRQKLKESEKLFRTLVEQTSAGVYIHDPVKNKLFYANPLIRNILKIKEDEIEKTDLFEYIHPEDSKIIKERTEKRLAGEKIDPSVEIRIYPPDKDMRWVRLYTTYIKYKGRTAVLASVIDINENKKARLKEKEHMEELERYKSTTIGREMRVIELKKEINNICKEQGIPIKYKSVEKEIKENNYDVEENL